MDFARRQLEKYGWSDGKGLGKNENGISEALKPKLKRSVAGIGHDAAADFTEHWWSQLYDKAAKNVEVEEKNGKTKRIRTKDAGEFEITNSTWKIKRKHNKNEPMGQYSEHFVKKAILDKGGVKMENISDAEEEEEVVKKDVFKMTDEELFAACEGRTAHKGARHGLKATGKLARIAQQEQLLLSQPKFNGYSHSKNLVKEKVSVNDLQVVEDISLNSDVDVTATKKKKKKRKRCSSLNNNFQINIDQPKSETLLHEDDKKEINESENVYESNGAKKSKKKLVNTGNEGKINPDSSAKKGSSENNLHNNMDVADNEVESKFNMKKKKSKKKLCS
ncbi:hypothetical protein evm_012998 [Chilo suppressalis]|nr:hypothetical protein evm_012998 [Chilo suppressalis]